MTTRLYRSKPAWRGVWYYLRCKTSRRPNLVNLEITKKCNARCSFCSCWQVGSSDELDDYSPIVKKFRPVVLSVSGGEPLIRRDYEKLLRGVRPYCHYLALITNGKLLNEESAKKLVGAGVDQICVSLDFLDREHDEARQVPGLSGHLSKTIPALAKAGFRIALNTIIMESNLDQILPIAYRAKEWGAQVSFSSFCALKRDDEGEMIKIERYTQLKSIVDELMKLKSELGHIKNSDYYLKAIPSYFRDGRKTGCKAGYNWIQVTPDGHVQQCSEMPGLCNYAEFSRKMLKPVTCAKCWYTCRGEAEAPIFTPQRLLELIRA